MVDSFASLVRSKVGHRGMYRDEETLQSRLITWLKLPEDIDQRPPVVVNLATGGSGNFGGGFIKTWAANIKSCVWLPHQKVLKNCKTTHPDIDIYTASLDEKLNENGYILFRKSWRCRPSV